MLTLGGPKPDALGESVQCREVSGSRRSGLGRFGCSIKQAHTLLLALFPEHKRLHDIFASEMESLDPDPASHYIIMTVSFGTIDAFGLINLLDCVSGLGLITRNVFDNNKQHNG